MLLRAAPVTRPMFASGCHRHHRSIWTGFVLASLNPRGVSGAFASGTHGNTGTPDRAYSSAALSSGDRAGLSPVASIVVHRYPPGTVWIASPLEQADPWCRRLYRTAQLPRRGVFRRSLSWRPKRALRIVFSFPVDGARLRAHRLAGRCTGHPNRFAPRDQSPHLMRGQDSQPYQSGQIRFNARRWNERLTRRNC